jgi:ribose 5-phosphate isomerase B
MKIGIGADHRGFRTKSTIIAFLKDKGYRVIDFGTDSEVSVDYPYFALRVAEAIGKRAIRYGILLCYSGQGMVITANKVKGIRAAVCPKPRYAGLARAHNNANILVIPAGFVKSRKRLQAIIETFLKTKFEGGRHRRRLNIIKRYEGSTGCV